MDHLPPLRLLVTFEAISRHGSMRDAAQRLNVTQPAVSQALKALEDHVGVALFDRSVRPARLTDAGEMLSRAVREGLGRIAATARRHPCPACHWRTAGNGFMHIGHGDLLVNAEIANVLRGLPGSLRSTCKPRQPIFRC